MTAIAGRRMAETVARRGGLVVIPQDIPLDVVTDVVDLGQAPPPGAGHPDHAGPRSQTVADALALLPKRAHGAGVVVEDGRPVGVVTEHDLTGVDRFTQLSEVMSRDLLVLDADIDPREAFNRLDAAHRKLAPAVDADGRLVGILTRKGALRATLYTPATDADGKLRIAAAVGINGDVAGPGQAAARRRRRHARRGHRARPPGVDDQRGPGGPRAGPAGPGRGGQRRRRRGRARPDRGRRGHHQGRCRTGRDVHHPDDDRRRPAAVLRGAGVRRRGAEVRQARLGRRRRPAPPRRRDGAGRRRVQRHDRLLVRRHPTSRPATSSTTADGRLYKESFGMASARAVRNRTSEESAYDRARKALFEEGISTSRMFLDPARPGVEDLIDSIIAGVRSSCTYAGAGSLAEFAERAVVGVQSAAGYAEGKPLHDSWN